MSQCIELVTVLWLSYHPKSVCKWCIVSQITKGQCITIMLVHIFIWLSDSLIPRLIHFLLPIVVMYSYHTQAKGPGYNLSCDYSKTSQQRTCWGQYNLAAMSVVEKLPSFGGSKCTKTIYRETNYLGPWKVERSIILCPYVRGSTTGGFSVEAV